MASTTLGPWRTAGAVGLVGGGAALAVDLITLHWSLSVLAGPAGIALFLFFLVGGIGSVVGRKGDRRLRRWAAEHPWETALVPAAGLAVTNTLTQFFLSSSGVFASIFTGLWHAAVLGVVIGVVGSVTASRRSRG